MKAELGYTYNAGVDHVVPAKLWLDPASLDCTAGYAMTGEGAVCGSYV